MNLLNLAYVVISVLFVVALCGYAFWLIFEFLERNEGDD